MKQILFVEDDLSLISGLSFAMKKQGYALDVAHTKDEANRLWDCDENYIDNNSLTVYIRRLRTKIEDDPGNPERIMTVRRMGYKWNAAE